MNPEQTPRSKEEMFADRDRLIGALKFKDEQTAANIAAGVISEGERDEDKEALEAELSLVHAEIAAIAGETSGGQDRLEGI
jgi:hypothetical protein